MYQPKNYDNLIGIQGLSEPLLKNHFTLYQGYVANFNKLNDILVAMEKDGKFGTPEYAELNRRFGWEFNGMRLHEYYFENLTKEFRALEKNSKLYSAIEKEFGSYEMWEKDFKAMGAMRGVGWVILYHDKIADRLFNVWINEHDVGHFAGAAPLLVMDVFEHAYLTDYGLGRKDYIEKFMSIIDWSAAENRYK
ncbi:MAG TPA: Fe-Mn family superoxide dismutase [Candidatus Paceibacterota bacterium]